MIFIDYFNVYFISDELTFFFDSSVNSLYNLIHDFNGKYYRPIPILLMESLYFVFGNAPYPFRLTSMILHLINLYLLYILASKIFQKKLSPFLTISVMMLFSPVYYEIFFWVATYFDLLFVLFGLLSIIYFIKYLETREYIHFLSVVFFVTFSVLSKETGLFLIPLFGFFELTGAEGIKRFIKKDFLKYISYLPLLLLFIFMRLATNRFFTTIDSFLKPLNLLIIGGGLIILIPFYFWMKKIKTSTKKFTILFSLVYTAPLLFHRTSRIFYFACVTYSLLLVYLFIDKYDFEILTWIKQLNFKNAKTIILVMALSGLITGSAFYLQYSKSIYRVMGNSMENISNQIALMAPNAAQKNIYILYLPNFGPYYFGFYEQEIRQNLRLLTFQDYNINVIYILDMNPNYLFFDILSLFSPYDYPFSIGAEPVNAPQFNQLTQDSNNLILLYSIDFQCVFGINGVVI
ncbi:MAG: glycosyltransferase family 39 protein [Candidatus Helarchaeota archaeon]